MKKIDDTKVIFHKEGLRVSEERRGHLYYYATDNDKASGFIDFQDGPIPKSGVNGLTNEALITILGNRIEYLDRKFPCDENKTALKHLRHALDALNAGTRDRRARDVEGFLDEYRRVAKLASTERRKTC